VGVTDAPGDAVTEWLELRADERRGTVFFGRDEDALTLMVAQGAASVLDDLARRFGARVGVSEPVPYAAVGRGVDQARAALKRGTDAVSHFADITGTGVLSALDTADGRALALALLAPLVAHDASSSAALVKTVRVWLEHDARFDVAAEVLGVHRHTVRARVALAEQLLGMDLGSFPARAEVWAALQSQG